MLNRLEELRKATKPKDEGAEEETETSFFTSITEALFKKQDDKGKENYFEDMVNAEELAHAKVNEFRRTIKKLRDTRACERQAVLPEKIQQLSNKLESEESQCMRLINNVKALLEDLRNNAKPTDPPEKKQKRETLEFKTYQRIRANYAERYKQDFDVLVQDFFGLRNQLRHEVNMFIRRRLRFAYPEANEDILTEVLLFPQLAKMAIDRRLEIGEDEEVPTLEDVFEELAESDFSQEIKLTTETAELKMLFIQFSELVAAQGEALSTIESNIQSTLTSTEDAIGSLEAAVDFKREAQRVAAMRKMLMKMVGIAACFFLLKMIGAPVEDAIAAVFYIFRFTISTVVSFFQQNEGGDEGGDNDGHSLLSLGLVENITSFPATAAAAAGAKLQQGRRTMPWRLSKVMQLQQMEHPPQVLDQSAQQPQRRHARRYRRRGQLSPLAQPPPRGRPPSATAAAARQLRGAGGPAGGSVGAGNATRGDDIALAPAATGPGSSAPSMVTLSIANVARSALPLPFKAVAVALTSRGTAVGGRLVAVGGGNAGGRPALTIR